MSRLSPGMTRLMQNVGVVLIGVASFAAAFGLAVLLATTDGLAGWASIVFTVVMGGILSAGFIRMSRMRRPRATAVVATVVGAVCGSVAVSIMLAMSSRDWQVNAPTVAHPGRSIISFLLFGAIGLSIGLPLLRDLHRSGQLFGQRPERAPIRPSNRSRTQTYRTD